MTTILLQAIYQRLRALPIGLECIGRKRRGRGEGDKMREEWVGERGGGVGEETEGRNERRRM